MDERNQLVRLASKAKTLDIMQVLLFVVMVASLVGLKKTVSPLCRHGPGRGLFVVLVILYRAFCGNVLRREEIGKGRRTMSKHMRPVYDERDDEIDAHSKSRAWDFVVVCIEVFTILCVVKGNTAWIGCLALLFAGMAANMMYRFDEYEERAYFHGGLILGAIGLALLIWFGVCG
ncbi:MAG: hypothetical protein ACLSB9_19720 [Hydrogeniiclostridium mannosilyticum]